MQLIDPSEGKELSEIAIAEIFDNPGGEPEEPPRGELTAPTSEELAFLDETLNIKAPEPWACLLYTSPSPRDKRQSRMPSSA